MKFTLRQLLAVLIVITVALALFVYVRHEWFFGERTLGRFTLPDTSEIRIFVDTSFDSMGGTYWSREDSGTDDFTKQYLTNSDQSKLSEIRLLALYSDDRELIAIVEQTDPNVVIAMVEMKSSFRYPNGRIDQHTENMLSKLQESNPEYHFELNHRIGPWGERLVK